MLVINFSFPEQSLDHLTPVDDDAAPNEANKSHESEEMMKYASQYMANKTGDIEHLSPGV